MSDSSSYGISKINSTLKEKEDSLLAELRRRYQPDLEYYRKQYREETENQTQKSLDKIGIPDKKIREQKSKKDSLRKKHLYYQSPFLTCSECNSIVFLDLDAIGIQNGNQITKTKFSESTSLRKTKKQSYSKQIPEHLVECPGCKRTISYQVGAHDYTSHLSSNAFDLVKKQQAQKTKVVYIQKAYRRYLHKKCHQAERQIILIQHLLYTRCATILQSMFRMRMSIRRKRVEYSLLVIRFARPLLMERALDNSLCMNQHPPNEKYPHRDSFEVFWYNSSEELEILYDDYYTLVERLGCFPPLHQVEKNLCIIAQRILHRQHMLVTRIQALWRALIMRHFFQNVYEREMRNLLEVYVCACIKIQSKWRFCLYGRFLYKRLRQKFKSKKAMEQYCEEKYLEQCEEEAALKRLRIMSSYRLQSKQIRTLKYLGYYEYGGNTK